MVDDPLKRAALRLIEGAGSTNKEDVRVSVTITTQDGMRSYEIWVPSDDPSKATQVHIRQVLGALIEVGASLFDAGFERQED